MSNGGAGGRLRREGLSVLEVAKILQWSIGRYRPAAVYTVQRMDAAATDGLDFRAGFALEVEGRRFKVCIAEITQ